MNYNKFKKTKKLELGLLLHLRLIEFATKIIKLDNYPDFDITGYDRHIERQYVFRDQWDFSGEYSAVIKPHVHHLGIFHYDDITRLAEEHNIPFGSDISEESVLNAIRKTHEDLMPQDATSPDFDGFKLNDVKVDGVDHFKKKILFIGGFSGGYSEIQPEDWSIYIESSFFGFVPSEESGGFYADLIAESYALRESGNNKLSFFLAFSALENFINERLNAHNKEGRLKEKLSCLFKSKFTTVEKNQIYTSIIGEYEFFESIRHKIAHGNLGETPGRDMADKLILFVLVVMSSIDSMEATFDGLHARVCSCLQCIPTGYSLSKLFKG